MPKTLALDASVAVKWFKKGEEGEKQALSIRDEVFTASTVAVAPHLLLLEVVRALVKVDYPRGKIEEAYSTMKEAATLELIKLIPVQMLLDKAKEIEIELKLFASDATYLAAAITERKNLLSDDSHLLKQNVREYAEKQGIHILPLKSKRLLPLREMLDSDIRFVSCEYDDPVALRSYSTSTWV